jgi:hypothetical protein
MVLRPVASSVHPASAAGYVYRSWPRNVCLVLLAELEIRHSRAIAPTRRVALGELWLPTDPAPGFGGVLLASIVAASVCRLDDEARDELDGLIAQIERGMRIPQPRLRYRFQLDTHGLERSHHRLVGTGESMGLEYDDHGSPMPQVLGAVYAAGKLSYRARPETFRLLRRATRWESGNDDRLLSYLTGDEAVRAWQSSAFDERWALELLGFKANAEPARSEILKRFRTLIFRAHPDHGGSVDDAGQRITELTEAKRILLAEA